MLWMVAVLGGCTGQNRAGSPAISWHAVDSLNNILPEGITVFEGSDPSWPLRAWYARVDPGKANIHLGVLQSDEEDGQETVSSFAYDEGACVVLNGGYFRMDLEPSVPIGLLLVDSVLVQQPTPSVLRDHLSYPIARAAFGVDGSGLADIAWVASADSALIAFESPPRNRPGRPVDSLRLESGTAWPMVHALSGGPALISNGKVLITVDEEVFFGSSIPEIHPRSAIGLTEDGEVLLLVVDGRQAASRGVDLKELAAILLELGSVEALNLDGGGSSALVVDGVRLNRPTGRDSEREVVSAIAAFCQ